jgi:tetratricopeptide (TPR) repeat protein
MNCHRVATDELAGRYLAGDLSDAEREAYEEHYFECDACFRELEILRTTRSVLEKDPPASDPIQKSDPIPRWLPIAAALAAATTLAVWWSSHQGTVPDQAHSPSSPGASASASPGTAGETRAARLTQMARFEPPRYEPPRLRGVPPAGTAAFERAMAHYQRGEFAAARPGLLECLRRNPDDIRAAFFLGVALLATDDTEAARRQLERVLAAGDSAYEEEAAYLLAKAHIKRGELGAAIAALNRTIALKGEREAEARALREPLVALDAEMP